MNLDAIVPDIYSKIMKDMYTTSWLVSATDKIGATLKVGDRVKIRDGYAVEEWTSGYAIYKGLSSAEADYSVVQFGDNPYTTQVLTAALEPAPFSREEKIEAAIDNFVALSGIKMKSSTKAALYAAMDDLAVVTR